MTDLEKMAHMWNVEEMSVTQIAAAFGTTRSAIAGKMSRHRDMFHARRNGKGCKPVEERRTKPRNDPEKAQEWLKAKAGTKDGAMLKRKPAATYEPISKAEAEAYDLSRIPHAKDMMEIGACQCRWWVSEGPIMFCAEVTVAGSSWCAHHKRRLAGRGTEGERKAVRDLRRAAA